MMDYKDTLNLPETKFGMRAGLAQKEPQMLARWQEEDLYGRIQEARKNAPKYILHDGPPYANGHLHHGHILNKILKDILVKDRTMSGFSSPYVPGWDCHGLPIEVQVDKRLGKKKEAMDKGQIHDACREYATEFVDIQREEFKRLGVLADWDKPYRTLDPSYEAETLRQLAGFADNDLLYKGLRPVYWCPIHQTALAEAELEYADHVSPSIYVAFALDEASRQKLKLDGDASVVIWTTTPWTLPANLAVCAHPELEYIAYDTGKRVLLFAEGLAEKFLAAIGEDFETANIKGRFKGVDLEGLKYQHPLFERLSPVILGDHVTLEAGTGLVHTAPGHGADDFAVGKKYGLDVLSPVDRKGVFTDDAGPYAGLFYAKANPVIIEDLVKKNALLSDPGLTVKHRYAFSWRSNKPTIQRATEQWWVAVDKPYNGGPSLRERALKAVDEVEWIPSWGASRIRGMLEARPDWCLSRQRTWGVPITAVFCKSCGETTMTSAMMLKVADVFEEKGAQAWFTGSIPELLGEDFACACGSKDLQKEEAILDVWFDSGVSHAAVVEKRGFGHKEGPIADVYLEGSDQHRGWFHTSLLCSLATRERAPYKTVLTHGFVVDGKGYKVSKSKGNAEDPFKYIKQNGAELLRLWVASEDYRQEIRVSGEILKRMSELYRKMRNTMRYALGSVADFDPNKDMVTADALEDLDVYALGLLAQTTEKVRAAYRTASFHQVVQTINEFCTVHLSSFYFDILKDRLYCERADGALRRSAQTAIYLIARDLFRLLAPVLSFTAEEAWAELPRLAGDPSSVHLALYPGEDEPGAVRALMAHAMASRKDLEGAYETLRQVRQSANAALEEARREKLIGSSTEAALAIAAPAETLAVLEKHDAQALADLFIVSQVTLGSGDDVSVKVSTAEGTKCGRCWLYRDVGSDAQHPTICNRCAEAL